MARRQRRGGDVGTRRPPAVGHDGELGPASSPSRVRPVGVGLGIQGDDQLPHVAEGVVQARPVGGPGRPLASGPTPGILDPHDLGARGRPAHAGHGAVPVGQVDDPKVAEERGRSHLVRHVDPASGAGAASRQRRDPNRGGPFDGGGGRGVTLGPATTST